MKAHFSDEQRALSFHVGLCIGIVVLDSKSECNSYLKENVAFVVWRTVGANLKHCPESLLISSQTDKENSLIEREWGEGRLDRTDNFDISESFYWTAMMEVSHLLTMTQGHFI